MKKVVLGAFEEIVLLTVGALHDNAYGVTIKAELEKQLKKSISIGALYAALQRLEEKSWVNTRVGGITEKQGGRRKQYYDITKEGVLALDNVRSMRNELFDKLPATKIQWLNNEIQTT
jgi:PadR family transcriptional regulator PadR